MKKYIKNKKFYLILPFIFLVIITSFLSLNAFLPNNPALITSSPSSETTGIRYDGIVCTKVIRGEGSRYGSGIEDNGCTHNNITFIGLNLTRDFLTAFRTTTSNGNFTTIAICNATSLGCSAFANQGNAGQGWNNGTGSKKQEYDVNGLSRQVGTFTILPNNNGNVSIFTTFTSSGIAGLEVNASALFNQTSIVSGWNGTMLAVDRFAQVTLDGVAGDQLTVNWTLMVS